MAPLIWSTVAICASGVGTSVAAAELADWGRPFNESGVDPALDTCTNAIIAIAANAAVAASDTLKRVRRRTDEAFTPLTLLRS
jgi:hypothetical protein